MSIIYCVLTFIIGLVLGGFICLYIIAYFISKKHKTKINNQDTTNNEK